MTNENFRYYWSPDLPWSFSAMEFQFCGPNCSTSCRSFSSSLGLQCPRGHLFESSIASTILNPNEPSCEMVIYSWKGEEGVEVGVGGWKEGRRKRINRIRVWMRSHFCQFYTKKCFHISTPETCVFGNWPISPSLSNAAILVTSFIDYMHSINLTK